MISSPASRGSSLSTNSKFASPPPKRCLKSIEKFELTCSKAVRSLSRPSLFRLAIPVLSVLIACSKSAFSAYSFSCSSLTSLASSSALKFTDPNASRCRFICATFISKDSALGKFSTSILTRARSRLRSIPIILFGR